VILVCHCDIQLVEFVQLYERILLLVALHIGPTGLDLGSLHAAAIKIANLLRYSGVHVV
jgi:hypothetical protein